MPSVNHVILVGHVGQDPEVRTTSSDKKVANISVATTRHWDKDGPPDWHRVQLWERLAEVVGNYVSKGDPIYIEGRIQYGTYTDKETGEEKRTTEIVASQVQLLGKRKGSEGKETDTAGKEKKSGLPKTDDGLPF